MRPASVLACALLAACARRPEPAAEAIAWRVDSTPRLTVGANEADPRQELAGVSGARISGGRLIVANSGSYELRIFDSSGKYLTTVGRRGQGPGEFTGVIYLFSAPGDSLYSFDAGSLRWSLHAPSGDYVRVLSGGPDALPRPTWLYRRSIVESNLPGAVPAWALGVLNEFPAPEPNGPVRRAKFDDLGYLWVADSGSTTGWTVFGDSSAWVRHVELPRGFALLQAGKDFVLGVEHGAMDQELVRAYTLTRSPALPPLVSSQAASFPPADRVLEGRMLAEVRDLLMAQEVFYSSHSSYTGRADSLPASLKSGAQLVLFGGDKTHWAGILYDPVSKTTCGLSVGFPAPPGWIDGMPFCGR